MPTAYVFSRQPAEPPTHLVGKTVGNAHVAAVAKLEGGEFSSFSKLEYEETLSLDTTSSDDPIGDVWNNAKVILGCESPDCHDVVDKVTSKVAVIGKDFRHLCFIVARAVARLEHLHEHEAELGADRIAAGTDGKGSVIVELAGHDEAELRARAEAIASHHSIEDASIHMSQSIVRAS